MFKRQKPTAENVATIDFSVGNIYGGRTDRTSDQTPAAQGELQSRREQTDALNKEAAEAFKGSPAKLAEFKEN